jgi:MFS family permease
MRISPAARWLISGATVHTFGETFYDLVMPLLVLALTGSPVMMAIMFSVGYGAEFLVAVFGGHFVDKYNRRKLLMVISASEAAIMLAAGGFGISFRLPVWSILVVAGLIDMLVRLYLIADNAALPQVVTQNQLPKANGILQAWSSAAQAIGPALAGIAIGATNPSFVLLITGLIHLMLLVLVSRVPWEQFGNDEDILEEKTIIRNTIEGWRFTFSNVLYRRVVLWRAGFDFFAGAAFLMLLFYYQRALFLNGWQIGIMVSGGALEGLAGGLALSRLQATVPSGKLLLGTTSGFALCLAGLAITPWWPVAFVFAMALMFFLSLVRRVVNLLFQKSVPCRFLGRVTATSQLFATGFGPVSILLAAWLTQNGNVRIVFWLSASALLVLVALAAIGRLHKANWSISAETSSEH